MKRGHVPIRTCRSCGKRTSKDKLNRFTLDQGALVESQEDGYGLYCCLDTECRTKIEKKLRKQKIVRADKERGQE